MSAIAYIQVRKGMVIIEDGQLQYVVERDLNTPGNWRAILQLKLRNLMTGNIVTRRVHPDNKVEQAFLDKRDMQYIYQDGDGYVFMDTENFEQITLARDWVGDQIKFLKEGFVVAVVLHEDKPISLELPPQVELTVTEAAPALKGATAASQYKPVILETGLTVQVPASIDVGERIIVDTSSGAYLSRVGR